LERSSARDHAENRKARAVARPNVSLSWAEVVVSVMVFWGVAFAALGWLVFKIAERM
jgi:hypothetical protein